MDISVVWYGTNYRKERTADPGLLTEATCLERAQVSGARNYILTQLNQPEAICVERRHFSGGKCGLLKQVLLYKISCSMAIQKSKILEQQGKTVRWFLHLRSTFHQPQKRHGLKLKVVLKGRIYLNVLKMALPFQSAHSARKNVLN